MVASRPPPGSEITAVSRSNREGTRRRYRPASDCREADRADTLPLISIPTTTPTCYRHPDRQTGRACTRCGRPACPECLVQASVGSQCVDCVRLARPPAVERLRRWNAGQTVIATKLIIGANVLVFLIGLNGANLVN